MWQERATGVLATGLAICCGSGNPKTNRLDVVMKGQSDRSFAVFDYPPGNRVQDDELPARKQEHANRVAMGFNKYVKQPKEIFIIFVSVYVFYWFFIQYWRL